MNDLEDKRISKEAWMEARVRTILEKIGRKGLPGEASIWVGKSYSLQNLRCDLEYLLSDMFFAQEVKALEEESQKWDEGEYEDAGV